jgi:hypothetical protein
MLGFRRHDHDLHEDTTTVVEKGPSLAKGPALLIGSILLAFGLAGMLENATFPDGTFPDGDAQGTNFLGFEVNGYTNLLLAICGGLLLFGAAQHWLAKTMSLLTGLALGAATIIALIDGDDILGMGATNNATKLGLAIAAAALLVNALMPRRTRRREVAATTADRDVVDRDPDHDADAGRERRPLGAAPGGRFRRRGRDTEPARDYEPVHDDATRVGVGPAPEAPDKHRRGGIF